MADRFFMRYPDGKTKALTFNYDDGVEQDFRLIEIFNRYGLKGTFNLNSGMYAPEGNVYDPGVIIRRMTKAQASELYSKGGHEVACHGAQHSYLDSLPPSAMAAEILNDRITLEEQFGRIVRGHAYAYGVYNEESIACLKTCGIVYSRTVRNCEKFSMPKNWLELDPTCHHKCPRLMELGEKFVRTKECRPLFFMVWGHSYEFEEDDNWQVMEDFAALISGKEDIWYATMGEIYDYIQDFGRLIYSADGKTVYNPTARTLWFESHLTDGKTVSIQPGQTIRF